MYELSFGMYFLYTLCTRGVQEKGAIGLFVLQSAEILGLIMFRNTIPMRDISIIHLSIRDQGVRCTTSALVCTSCTPGVQQNGAIAFFVHQTAEILGLIICFAIHFLCVKIE